MNIPRALAVILCLIALPSFAQTYPSPKLHDLESFLGIWSCQGATFGNAPHATVADLDIKQELLGFWIRFEYAERRSAQNSAPYSEDGAWGYDAGTKVFMSGSLNNKGGFANGVSPGWQGSVLVFTETTHAGGGVLATRTTFARKSASEFVHTFEGQDPAGAWHKLSEQTCTKLRTP